MRDLTISLENRPGSLAEIGKALGRAGVSVEGGGAFVVDDFEKGQAVSEMWKRGASPA